MKGIAFHWDSPWKDIYSGLDPMADAWAHLGTAFGLELVAIQNNWPFPDRTGIKRARSMDAFLASFPESVIVLADYPFAGNTNPDLCEVDWLVFGPSDGWNGTYPQFSRWRYAPSPGGGYHAIHLAHIAAHIGKR